MSVDATETSQITAEPPQNATGLRQRPHRSEHQQIIAACRDMFALGARNGEVKSRVSEQFGISPRTVERYMRRARDAMVEETTRSRTELRAEAAEVYRIILRDETANHFAKMKAQERIDKLFGLESPQQIEHSGRDGGPIPFAAILAEAKYSEPPGEERTGNVVDVDAEVSRIEAEHNRQ